jgi:divalent metal cation (Fe/Co/Zn/Cd) transporter
LLISTFLFLAITSGQYFAAIAAASLSLKADCISMLVDALSYIANLFAECTPNPRTKKKMELSMR